MLDSSVREPEPTPWASTSTCFAAPTTVGSATGDDLTPRIEQHNAGAFPGYTYNRRPVVLVWSEYFDRITDGIAAERQIKGWNRAKKEALIKSDWDTISQLARRRSATASPSS
ncbi:putative endonuclease [Bradyrhizobium sp. USDA 4473]